MRRPDPSLPIQRLRPRHLVLVVLLLPVLVPLLLVALVVGLLFAPDPPDDERERDELAPTPEEGGPTPRAPRRSRHRSSASSSTPRRARLSLPSPSLWAAAVVTAEVAHAPKDVEQTICGPLRFRGG